MDSISEFELNSNQIIVVSNVQDGETVCYSLVLIKGHVKTTNQKPNLHQQNVTVTHLQENATTLETLWPISALNSEFKVMIRLHQGMNEIGFEFSGTKMNMSITFRPKNSTLHVTPVYIVCKGHDGKFQAPADEDNSVESACRRISLGIQLIQCLTAEKLYELNLGRKTFQLAHDLENASPECIVFNSQLPVESARRMAAGDLWEYFGRELMMSHLGNDKRKFVAFLSCTRYCPKLSNQDLKPQTHEDILSMTEGHVTLGGGGLALFGTACLHTWAESLSEILHRFSDDTEVDTTQLMDDSSYRGTYGGCFATTLGGVCHELGHTFDLGHSFDGIMGRNFDNVDMVFTLHGGSDNESVFSDDGLRNLTSSDFKDVGQHLTISFTKVLNVSYTMSSPVRRPRKMGGSSRYKRPPSLSAHQHNKEVNQFDVTSKEKARDHTFWSKSCGVLLSFHRWFNDEINNLVGVLKFKPHRKVLTSSAGIRVVQIRDSTGFVVNSWEFLNKCGRDTFILPTGIWFETTNVLVAEDSVGNIVRHTF